MLRVGTILVIVFILQELIQSLGETTPSFSVFLLNFAQGWIILSTP